jgi:cytoskeletal protein CcmA (bactofilin family)
MWGRKDGEATDSQAAKPASSASGVRPAPRATERPSSIKQEPRTAPKPVSPGASNSAQIGKSLRVKGTVSGSEDLYIDGIVEGTIKLESNNLTIGPNGKVQADVEARSIIVLGTLQGNVRVGERIEIRKTGSLEGDLITSRIVIEDGAVFRGSIDIEKPTQARASATAPSAASKTKPAVPGQPVAAGKPGA